MATQTTVARPAPFVEKLGTNLAENVLAQQGVPIVTQGLGALQQAATTAGLPQTKQDFETQEQFEARQKLFDAQQRAALGFEQRQLALEGLAPTVAGQTAQQQEALRLAEQASGTTGIASFQPFLTEAQQAATAAGTTLGGVGLGATAFQQGVQDFMSPYQTQVIDATLAEFDRNKQIQEQQIRDQQTALGALGSGRAGVQLAEFGTGAARERALLQAGLLQQGFGQAAAARQQDIANRGALATQQQGLGAFQAGLGGQREGVLGSNIARLGQLGALNQAQAQAVADANREAARMAAFQPQEQLDRFAAQVTGIMGGYPGQTQTTNIPNPTPLQTALGIGTTLAGIYGGFRNPGKTDFGSIAQAGQTIFKPS
jgi:hypothetical protein